MSLIRITPWQSGLDRHSGSGFQTLWNEMNNLFDTFSSDNHLPATFHTNAFVPALDVKEDEKNIYVHAELPGLTENDLHVSVKDGILTLKGEKKSEQKTEKDNFLRMERSYGSFHRTVALSSEVDTAKVDAVFKNGILSVTLPKTTTEKTEQKIKIKSA